jgi:hypothetical protein
MMATVPKEGMPKAYRVTGMPKAQSPMGTRTQISAVSSLLELCSLPGERQSTRCARALENTPSHD